LPVTLRITLTDLHQILHALDHFPEYGVAIVEMWSSSVGYEELRATRVWPGVRHR
jgi:hypothetical protein